MAEYNRRWGSGRVSGMGGIQRIGSAANINPGATTGALSTLAGSYQSAYDQANAANEARYQQVLSEGGSLYDRTMSALDTRSTQAEEDIGERWDAQKASGRQSLTDRGLTNTTILDTMESGYEAEKGRDINRYRDEQLDRRIGMDVGLTGDRLGFIERREDQGPNMDMLGQLAMMIGQAGPYGMPGLEMVLPLLQAGLGGSGGAPSAGSSPALPSGLERSVSKSRPIHLKS